MESEHEKIIQGFCSGLIRRLVLDCGGNEPCELPAKPKPQRVRSTDAYNVPEKYKSYWYLRDIDLVPESFAYYPHPYAPCACEEFEAKGWLFPTREAAMAAYRIITSALEVYRSGISMSSMSVASE